MLLKMVQALNKKQSEEAYKNYLKHLGISTIILGLIGIPVILSAKLTSFGSGMLTGMTITFIIYGIYILMVRQQPKRLHRMYVDTHDERNKMLLMVTALATMVFVFVLNFVLLALYAFMNLAFSYPVLLIAMLYGIISIFAILYWIFSKIL